MVLDAVLQALSGLRGVRLESFDRNSLARALDAYVHEVGISSLESLSRRVVNDESLRASVHDRLLPPDPGFSLPPEFASTVIEPALERRRVGSSRPSPLRFWIVGCGEGALPVQLAAAFAESQLPDESVRILATDVDRIRVRRASDPVFSQDAIPRDLLESSFTHECDALFRPRRDLCFGIHVEVHDPLTAPPFRGVDAILCPTYLGHVKESDRPELLHRFAISLAPGGVLWCPGAQAEDVPDLAPIAGRANYFHASESGAGSAKTPTSRSPRPSRRRVYEALLSADVDLALLIDSDLEVLAVLRSPENRTDGGKLRHWVDVETAAKLRVRGLSMESGTRALIRNPSPDPSGNPSSQVFDVRALGSESGTKARFLLLRREIRDSDQLDGIEENVASAESEARRLEAANHDLQSSNAELLAETDSLRQSNQELESIRTELRAINRRHLDRIAELQGHQAFAAEIARRTDLAALHLDLDGRLQAFSDAASRLLHLVEHDLGRRIVDIANRFDEIDLPTLAQRAFDADEQVSATATDASGTRLRIVAERLQSREGRSVGVLMTLSIDGEEPEPLEITVDGE